MELLGERARAQFVKATPGVAVEDDEMLSLEDSEGVTEIFH